MKRAAYLILGTALVATPFVLPSSLMAADAPAAKAAPKAAAVKATPAAAVVVKRNAYGQPVIGGMWTNATITKETRPAGLGNRLVYTPDEVRREEGVVQTEIAVGNRNTDPNAPPPTKGGDALPAGIRPELAAGGGAVGGYDRGWLDTGSAVMRVHGEPRTSILTTPDGRYPARKAGAPAPSRGPVAVGRVSTVPGAGGLDNPEQRSAGDRCILSFGRNAGPPMLANGYYNNNYNIVQGKDSVAITTEMVHDTRIVRLNSTHRIDGVRPYFGDSIGHYEGNSLIVETTNIPQSQAYANSWEHLTVTEKFTPAAGGRLLYQYTIHDPTLWDTDWGGEYEFAPLQPGQHVEEYACHEGNYALTDILAGARADDAAAAKSTASAAPAAPARAAR